MHVLTRHPLTLMNVMFTVTGRFVVFEQRPFWFHFVKRHEFLLWQNPACPSTNTKQRPALLKRISPGIKVLIEKHFW